MKNIEVAESWLSGEMAYGSHFFTDGKAIFSYGLHFPIAYRFDDGVILMNEDKYSKTTSKQTTLVKQAIKDKCSTLSGGFVLTIIYVNTADLKGIAKQGISLKGIF
jgi:hypothetical protein